MYRETIIDDDDYTADLDYQHGELFIHLDVHNFNKEVYERIVNDWLDMEEALVEEGFTRVFAIPQKKGLVEMMGWEKVVDMDKFGKKWEVYVWDLLPYQ